MQLLVVAWVGIVVPPGAFANIGVIGWDAYAIVMALAIVEGTLLFLPTAALPFAIGLRQTSPRALWPALGAAAVIAILTIGANLWVVPRLILERQLYVTSATERSTESQASPGSRGRREPLAYGPLWHRVARLKDRAVPDPPVMPLSSFGTLGVAMSWALSAFAFAGVGLWWGRRTKPRPARREILRALAQERRAVDAARHPRFRER